MKKKWFCFSNLIFLFFIGCNPVPTMNNTNIYETTKALPTFTPLPSLTITPAFTPSINPTATSISTPRPTSLIPSTQGIITHDNVNQIKLLATWGKGSIQSTEWLASGSLLVVQTVNGVYVHNSEDWSQTNGWPGGKALAISNDGSTIAIGFGEGRVIIWKVGTTKQIEINQGDDNEVNNVRNLPDAIALSNDGMILAVADQESSIQLWNTVTESSLSSYEPNSFLNGNIPPRILEMCFSPDGALLAIVDEHRNITIFNVERGKNPSQIYITGSVKLNKSGYFSNKPFSPDSSKLVTIQDMEVVVWDTNTGKLIYRRPFIYGINQASFSDDGQYIVINDYIEIIRAKDGLQVPLGTISQNINEAIPDLSSLESTDYFPGIISGIGIDANEHVFAWGINKTGDQESPLWWRINGHQIISPNWSHCENLNIGFNFGVRAISPDCSMEAIARGGLLSLYRTSDHSVLQNLYAHTQEISTVVFSNGGKYFASGIKSAGGTLSDAEVFLWRTDPTSVIWKIKPGKGGVNSIAFSPDETMLAIASDHIRLYRFSDQQETGSILDYATALAISPDNLLLAVAKPGELIFTVYSLIDLAPIYSLVDSEYLASFYKTKGMPNLLIPDFTQVYSTSLSFTSDGKGLLAGLSDGTVRYYGLRGNNYFDISPTISPVSLTIYPAKEVECGQEITVSWSNAPIGRIRKIVYKNGQEIENMEFMTGSSGRSSMKFYELGNYTLKLFVNDKEVANSSITISLCNHGVSGPF
jgi:WD40 repeat protein